MRPSAVLRTLAGALVAVALASPAAAQGRGETLKIQDYPGTGNMLARVAVAKGYCEKHGLKCTLQTIPSTPLGAQALLAKSIDVAMLGADVMTPAIAAGGKMKLVTGAATTVLQIAMVGNHVDAPNAGRGYPAIMQDMKGKKVGVAARGSGLEKAAVFLLQKAGMKPEDVTFVAVGGADTGYGALVSRQIDFLFHTEPVGTMCDVMKTCRVVWRGSTSPEPAEFARANGGTVGHVMRQDAIDQNPHVVEAFVKAMQDAEAFMNAPANFPEVKQIAERFFRFSFDKGDEVLDRLLRQTIADRTYTAGFDRAATTSALKLYADMGVLDRVLPESDLVDPRTPPRGK